jgi:hypothetical protein
MSKKFPSAVIFAFCTVIAVFAFGEKPGEYCFTLGGEAGWGNIQERDGIVEAGGLRPCPVLLLDSASNEEDRSLQAANGQTDLYLSFDEGNTKGGAPDFHDETGNYTVSTAPTVSSVDRSWAWKGAGAALFSGIADIGEENRRGISPIVLQAKNSSALFSNNKTLGDWTISFELCPGRPESGETVFSWSSNRKHSDEKGNISNAVEKILCTTAKNHLRWSFSSFFQKPGDGSNNEIVLEGRSALTPGVWSSHIVRWSHRTGLLEYLVDGRIEASAYTTISGQETPGGTVLIPMTGSSGSIVLGESYEGLLDEFRITRAWEAGNWAEGAMNAGYRYPSSGGRIQSAVLDLGGWGAKVLRLNVKAGVTNYNSENFINIYNYKDNIRTFSASYAENNQSGAEDLVFYVRAGESRYNRDALKWQRIQPDARLSGITGRYVEIACEFAPGKGMKTSPYLEEMNVLYATPPKAPAPRGLAASSGDGTVTITWKPSAWLDTASNTRLAASGYLLYYGIRSGVYTDAAGPSGMRQNLSPIDVGNKLSYTLSGLENGRLYYFAVSAYNAGGPENAGALSGECEARPLSQNGGGL